MNRIFRKCGNFGLMVRLNDLEPDEALTKAKELIKGNAPLIVVDISKGSGIKVLNKVAFNADLFIAAEGIRSLDDAYRAAGNGAQFFILDSPDKGLMDTLSNYGFFYIPKVSTLEELKIAEKYQVDGVLLLDETLVGKSSTPYVLTGISKTSDKLVTESLFSIIDLHSEVDEVEEWINSKLKAYLDLSFYRISLKDDATEEARLFAEIFASTNKAKLVKGDSNKVYLKTNNLEQCVNYLKWREVYIDPDLAEVKNRRVIKGPLDTKINGFTIVLEEKYDRYN